MPTRRRPKPFTAVHELMTSALALFALRRRSSHRGCPVLRHSPRAMAAAEVWHARLAVSDSLPLARELSRTVDGRSEREFLTALVGVELGVATCCGPTLEQLADFTGLTVADRLPLFQNLQEDGALRQADLVLIEDDDESFGERKLVVNSRLVRLSLGAGETVPGTWAVATEADLHAELGRYVDALQRVADAMEGRVSHRRQTAAVQRAQSRLEKVEAELLRTLEFHPAFKLSTFVAELGHRIFELRMLLALVGKELGHLDRPGFDAPLNSGLCLARGAAGSPQLVQRALDQLSSRGFLRAQGWVQPSEAESQLLTDNRPDLQQAEFELTDLAIERLGLRRAPRSRQTTQRLIDPRVRLEDLILAPAVLTGVAMALAAARNRDRLYREWNLARCIPYGQAVTLLFHGPPGTGKTATAEAIARELGQPLLVADYSQIQNCLVGATEKNIVRIFREARTVGAVLFWDEADAMFFDRNDASRAWEVRDVNVLLQQLEAFEGVCILATNRRRALDAALARRITLELAFTAPTPDERLQILRRLIPPELPLAPDVDLAALSTSALSGGGLKNLVLNAARAALLRSSSTVAQADFLSAARSSDAAAPGPLRPIGFSITKEAP